MTTNDDIAKRAQEVIKRYASAHKASIAKVAQHLNLAKSAHMKGMSSLKKAAGCMVDAQKIGKAADQGALAGHISSAHDHFSESAGHMDDMEAHLGKAMSAWGSGTGVDASTEVGGEMSLPGLAELTEGHVPEYEADSEYGKLVKLIASGGLVTKDQAEAMVKQASETAALRATVESLTKSVDTLSRMPAGAPRVKVFDFDKSALPGMDGGDSGRGRLDALMEGVDLNIRDEQDFTKASSGMIANMIKHGPRLTKPGETPLFGKPPMFDPTFQGRGGTGAR